jgi:hypothetical protein
VPDAGRHDWVEMSARLTLAALATCAAAVAGIVVVRDDGGGGAEAGVPPAGIVVPTEVGSSQDKSAERAANLPGLAPARKHARKKQSAAPADVVVPLVATPRSASPAPAAPAPAAPAPAPAPAPSPSPTPSPPPAPTPQPPPVDFLSSG